MKREENKRTEKVIRGMRPTLFKTPSSSPNGSPGVEISGIVTLEEPVEALGNAMFDVKRF